MFEKIDGRWIDRETGISILFRGGGNPTVEAPECGSGWFEDKRNAIGFYFDVVVFRHLKKTTGSQDVVLKVYYVFLDLVAAEYCRVIREKNVNIKPSTARTLIKEYFDSAFSEFRKSALQYKPAHVLKLRSVKPNGIVEPWPDEVPPLRSRRGPLPKYNSVNVKLLQALFDVEVARFEEASDVSF